MTNASGVLPNSTGLGPVHLRLTSIANAIPLWVDVVGLTVIANGESGAELGVAGRTLLALHPGAQSPVLGKSVGLFHLALHVPTRLALARLAARLRAAGYPHSGQDISPSALPPAKVSVLTPSRVPIGTGPVGSTRPSSARWRPNNRIPLPHISESDPSALR